MPRMPRAVLAAALLLAAPALADPEAGSPYSPYGAEDFPRNVYWGDLHVHSSWSADAGGAGNEKLTPEDAFAFARGETVIAHNGEPVRLRRPLDFLLVSDHSEYLGIFPMLEEGFPSLIASETGARWASLVKQGRRSRVSGEFIGSLDRTVPLVDREFVSTMWRRVIENAERANRPGRFTAFIGYEWTSMPAGANLHRNVLFRDGAERTRQVDPFSSVESQDPEALWAYLDDYESKTGGGAIAIPHNSNLSAGRMFEHSRFDGGPLTRAYAESRTRFEPIVEATQIKGDSETAPFLSPDDEFADFGTWDARGGMGLGPHEEWMYAKEYVRPALGHGLALGEKLGANPFRFGLIGSTDAHTSLATADDEDFWGKFSSNEPYAGRQADPWAAFDMPENLRIPIPRELPPGMLTWSLVASGYAGVWARENTRASLFDAMKRRETYSTTGPRMSVRFFGGWGYAGEDALAHDVARIGYAGGVPMGGVLGERGEAEAPRFLVSVLRDPEGANLDRAQVVKLWVDADGALRERIFDVAVSGGRAIGEDGRCREPVGSTVDVEAATYTNAIGSAELATVWSDPAFDPARPALYYLRALEIPTPRWTTYDAARLGTERPADAPEVLQQRAYTSPIWYSPAGP